MFNKKKKHVNTSHKPHYTRQDNDPNAPAQNQSSGPADNGNAAPQDQAQAADTTPVLVNNVPVQPTKDDPVIYPFKSKSNPNPVKPNQFKPNNFSGGSSGRNPRNFQQPKPSGDNAEIDPYEPDYSLSQNPNIDPNAVPDPADLTVKTCQICNMPIRSVNTAVHHNVTNELVHFDCALRELTKEFNPKLGRFKKIYYVGAGNFALVKEIYDRRGHLKSYEVLERIPYEAKEK